MRAADSLIAFGSSLAADAPPVRWRKLMPPLSGHVVFEIPIYWRKEDDFNARYDRDLKQHLEEFEKRTGGRASIQAKRLVEAEFSRRYVAPWRYNQAVGWLQLYLENGRICADQWLSNRSRFGRQLQKKEISSFGKAFEVRCDSTSSSRSILRTLVDEIEEVDRNLQPPLFLDLEAFRNLAPFVSWRKLLNGFAAT